jgi:hypothetical protein
MPVLRYPITIDGETATIGTAGELVVALDVLQGQYDRAVLEQLRPHLAEIVGGPAGLYAVLRILVPEDQEYLLQALGPSLEGVVQRAGALRDILATLAETRVEERLLETIGAAGLRRLLGTAQEVAEVLEWVYGDCDRLLLQLLGPDFLASLLTCGYDLSLVLRSLESTGQQGLLDMLGWERVVGLVGDRRDLAHLLRALPAEISGSLLEHLDPARLRQIVRDRRGRGYLESYLEPDEAAWLDERLEVSDAE